MAALNTHRPNMKTKIAPVYSTLYPLISKYHQLLNDDLIKPYDFVGIVILAYVSLKKPRCYFDRMIEPPIIDIAAANAVDSISVTEASDLIELLNIDYLIKKFKITVIPTSDNGNSMEDKLIALRHLRISSIFNQMKLAGIKQNTDNYINHSIMQWANNKRPFVLMFTVPSPMRVLKMQAVGTRVITVFVQEEELDKKHVARLNYMEGNTAHEKDSFEFLIHDLKHMEHFVDEDKYLEQVGFFHSMLTINEGNLKKYFTNTLYPNDIALWHALEYVISDMNCYLPHLFKYLLAKLIGATKTSDISSASLDNIENNGNSTTDEVRSSQFTLSAESIEILQQKWEMLLNEMNPTMKTDSPDVYRIASKLCRSILHLSGSGWSNGSESESVGSIYTDQSALMTVSEAELLRDYYKSIGRAVLETTANVT